MSEFLRMAERIGGDLASAGFALEAIGNLLGADGAERHINAKLENGLHHAVVALGRLVHIAGGKLCEAVEDEAENARDRATVQEVNHG